MVDQLSVSEQFRTISLRSSMIDQMSVSEQSRAVSLRSSIYSRSTECF